MAKPADFSIANASGANVRSDLNDVFESIVQNHGYGSVPSTLVAYMWYANTVSGRMGFYKNPTSGGRHEFISLADGNFYGPDGSAGTPSYTFTNSPSTGFYRSASNQIGVSVNGSLLTEFKANKVDLAGDLFIQRSGADSQLTISTGVNDQDAIIDLVADTTYTDYGLRVRRTQTANGISEIVHRGTGSLDLVVQDAGSLRFKTTNTERFQILSGGAFQAVDSSMSGASSAAGTIHAKGFGTRTGVATDSGNNNAASASTANLFNIWWDGSGGLAYFFIDNTRLGYLQLGTSDYRKKRNIENLDINGIERLKKLRPVKYQDKAFEIFEQTEALHEGFIAHEVQEVIPDAVKQQKDKEIQSIDYLPMLSTLTKALQEAVAKIETLETKVAALEAS